MKVIEFLKSKLRDLEKARQQFIQEKYNFNNHGHQQEMDEIDSEIKEYQSAIKNLEKGENKNE